MINASVIQQVINGESNRYDFTSRKFDWMLSDYKELTWRVRDPENLSSPIRASVNFDGPLIGGGRLNDIEGLVDDLKCSLIIAVEFSAFKGQAKIRSCSTMRNHVLYLKRVFNEIYDIGRFRWDRWSNECSGVLVERLKTKPSRSQQYLPRLMKYVESVGIASLPILHFKGCNEIDRTLVYGEIGIDRYHAQQDTAIKAYWRDVYIRFNQQSTSIQLRRDERGARATAYKASMSRDQYHDILRAIELYQKQTMLMPEQFKNASSLTLIGNSSSIVRDANIKPSNTSRTKNIPVPLFLTLLDASIRYIINYSDALFSSEKKLAYEHKKLTKKKNNYEAGKKVNEIAREMGEVVNGKFSPFPLAAYKHYQSCESKIRKEELREFCELLNLGFSPKEVRRRLNLSTGQYYYRFKVSRNIASYSRDLPHTGISLQKALYQFLPLSCLVVIFAFSARRESEVFGLEAGCCKKFHDGWRVNFYVAKSSRQHKWFTSVPVVIKAIKTLEKLSEEGRKISGSDSLYRFDDTFNRAPINMDRLNIAMEPFLDFIGVGKSESDQRFKFSEHQFRRFFAIMYFYRYEKQPDLEALTYELRHEDWSNTAVYLTEQESGRIFREVEKEYMADKIVGMLDVCTDSSGVLFELRERIKKSVDVVPENRAQIAMKYIDENGLRMDFISEGLCFGNTPGRTELSQCISDGYVMCHNSSEEMCSGCPNLLPVENIKKNKNVAAIQGVECDNASILDAAISFSNNVRGKHN